jgi:EAL domain-containing protein (putative c-di-GMP-specific phosphodiesterase class I)
MAISVQPALSAFTGYRQSEGSTAGWYIEGFVEPGRPMTQFPLGSKLFRIGRDRNADLALPSRLVSKHHADLVVAGNTAFVRDCNSTNGTYVNGRRLGPNEATPIGSTDLLQFADVEFRVGRVGHTSNSATYQDASPEKGWLFSSMTDLVENERLHMAFQAIVEIHSGAMIGAEALVRSPVSGLENPGAIFSAAAQLGWSERVSDLCRTTAVETVNRIGGLEGALFVNTDPSERLDEVLITSMQRLRHSAGELPIVLEIHEAAVPNLDTIREFRAALIDLDVKIAYDDFGAGQSRLLELSQVPPDFLKFDRSLLKDIDQSSSSHRMLLGTLLEAVRDAGVVPLAEGLERIEEVEVCREMGFELAQGYYFGRPVPLEALGR